MFKTYSIRTKHLSKKISEFLTQAFKQRGLDISKIIIFGSVAKRKTK
jgi:rRNA maturation protein Rpf1